MPRDPKLLVLGSTGRLGRLIRAAWPVNAGIEPIWHGRAGAVDRRFDILTDAQALADAIHDADIVISLAGITPATERPDFNRNISLLQNVLEQLGAKPALFASSAAVYGVRAGNLMESEAVSPVSDYGRSKARMEAIVHAQAIRATCLRIGNVLGADALFGAPSRRIELDQFESGETPIRSYIGPVLLARVFAELALLLSEGRQLPEFLNVATPEPVSMASLLDAAGLPYTLVPAGSSAIPRVALDTELLSRHVVISPEASQALSLVKDWRSVVNTAA